MHKPSWRFFAGLLAGFLLAFGVMFAAFCFALGAPTDSSRWASEVTIKKRLLAARADSPKLLLVGGSATLFGISAREIESETGRRTINLGCHAALGSAYMLYEAQRVAKPGDTVLLVLEYELYNHGKLDRDWSDVLLLDYIVARAPDYYFHRLSLAEQWNVLMFTSSERLKQGLKKRRQPEPPHDPIAIYDVREVNDWGDQTHHAKTNRPAERRYVLNPRSELAYGLTKKHKEAFALIQSFSRWARASHIRVLAAYPNLCDQPEYHGPAARQTAQTIKDCFARLDVPVVGTYTDALLPADQFFDTYYHLTEEMALERTRRLSAQLRPYLN
jgi:hypothetical protein